MRWLPSVALVAATLGCGSEEPGAGTTAAPAVAVDPGGPSGIPAAVDRSLFLRDITQWAGLAYPVPGDRGLAFMDADDDGIDDIVMAAPEVTTIFRGRGDGSFYPLYQVSHPDVSGTYPYALDATGDGVDDILLVHEEGALLLRGFGNGAFEVAGDVVREETMPPTIATFGDFDGDQRMDVYLGFMSFSPDGESFFDPEDCSAVNEDDPIINLQEPAVDRLMMNRESGWEDATEAAGLAVADYTQALMVVDLNEDGHLDLLVGTEGIRSDLTFYGDGRGHFTDVSQQTGMTLPTSAMGFDAADIDFDGDLDVYVTDDLSNDGDKLYVQTSPGKFTMATEERGLRETGPGTGWGLGFHDLDHDADFDLFVANGIPLGECPGGEQENFLFHGDPTGHFTFPTIPSGGGLDAFFNSRAALFSDVDLDGDLDVLVSNINAAPTLLRNDMPTTGHWLHVRLKHPRLSPVVGARVTLRAGGRTHRRDVHGTPSYGGSSTHWIHFGLGDATEATDLTVRWPDGTEQVVGTVPADQRITVTKE